jgi:hypothetical protein
MNREGETKRVINYAPQKQEETWSYLLAAQETGKNEGQEAER